MVFVVDHLSNVNFAIRFDDPATEFVLPIVEVALENLLPLVDQEAFTVELTGPVKVAIIPAILCHHRVQLERLSKAALENPLVVLKFPQGQKFVDHAWMADQVQPRTAIPQLLGLNTWREAA